MSHDCSCHYGSPAHCAKCGCSYGRGGIDPAILHAALIYALPSSYGSPHQEDQLAEVRRIADQYNRLAGGPS